MRSLDLRDATRFLSDGDWGLSTTKASQQGKIWVIWFIVFYQNVFPALYLSLERDLELMVWDCYGHMDLSICFFRSCCNRTVVGAASKQICSWRPVRITINFSCPFAHFETHSFYITYIYIYYLHHILHIYYLYHIYYIIYYIIYSLFFAMCFIFLGWISLWMQRTLSMVPWH